MSEAIVVRTWKSNGDMNYMSEDAAVKNLEQHAVGISALEPKMREKAVRKALQAGEAVETPLASFRTAAAIFAMLLIGFLALPICAQVPPHGWYWTVIDTEEIALWRDGIQIGAYNLDTDTYLPRYGPGHWGVPEDPPVDVPAKWLRQTDARKNWRTQGIIGPNGKPEVPHTGLHIRQVVPAKQQPKKPTAPFKPPGKIGMMQDYGTALAYGAEQVPDYSSMGSLTFVAKDSAIANAAMQMFQTAPEFAPYRERYGRVKAYGESEFAHTSYAFKLEEDQQYQQGGFVAFAQPEPPDQDGKAVVHPIYEWSSPQQAATALRDADPNYHPKGPDSAVLSEWEPWHYGAAGGLTVAIFGLLGAANAYRKRATPMF